MKISKRKRTDENTLPSKLHRQYRITGLCTIWTLINHKRQYPELYDGQPFCVSGDMIQESSSVTHSCVSVSSLSASPPKRTECHMPDALLEYPIDNGFATRALRFLLSWTLQKTQRRFLDGLFIRTGQTASTKRMQKGTPIFLRRNENISWTVVSSSVTCMRKNPLKEWGLSPRLNFAPKRIDDNAQTRYTRTLKDASCIDQLWGRTLSVEGWCWP